MKRRIAANSQRSPVRSRRAPGAGADLAHLTAMRKWNRGFDRVLSGAPDFRIPIHQSFRRAEGSICAGDVQLEPPGTGVAPTRNRRARGLTARSNDFEKSCSSRSAASGDMLVVEMRTKTPSVTKPRKPYSTFSS